MKTCEITIHRRCSTKQVYNQQSETWECPVHDWARGKQIVQHSKVRAARERLRQNAYFGTGKN